MYKEYYIISKTEELAEKCIYELERVGASFIDIYSPRKLDYKKTKKKSFYIGLSAFISGVIGFALSILFQYWSSFVDYPINVGGKPFFEIVYSIPVTFALTSLFAALGGIICFMFLSGLPNWDDKKIGEILLPTDKYVIKFSIEGDLSIHTLNSENFDIIELK
jgi:hypothetical protein